MQLQEDRGRKKIRNDDLRRCTSCMADVSAKDFARHQSSHQRFGTHIPSGRPSSRHSSAEGLSARRSPTPTVPQTNDSTTPIAKGKGKNSASISANARRCASTIYPLSCLDVGVSVLRAVTKDTA